MRTACFDQLAQCGVYMKFMALGGKYTLKNCWWLMLIWLIPSIFVGLCCEPFGIIRFLNIYPQTTISDFADVFAILLPVSWLKVMFVLLGILLVSLFLSMAVGQTESHMRSGKLNFKEIFSHINNDILVVLVNVVIIEILYLALSFILGSVIFLFHLITSGLTHAPSTLCVIIAIVLSVATLLIYLLTSALFLINIPNMISNGYSLKEGVSSTAELIGKSTFKLVLAYLLPYVVIIPLISLLCKTSVWWLGSIISCLILATYYTGLTMSAYFELSDTSRYDNRKYYNYR